MNSARTISLRTVAYSSVAAASFQLCSVSASARSVDKPGQPPSTSLRHEAPPPRPWYRTVVQQFDARVASGRRRLKRTSTSDFIAASRLPLRVVDLPEASPGDAGCSRRDVGECLGAVSAISSSARRGAAHQNCF